jgi:hypothetical protein
MGAATTHYWPTPGVFMIHAIGVGQNSDRFTAYQEPEGLRGGRESVFKFCN